MGLPQFTLVLGGASSGKSTFAEALVLKEESAPVYLATAQAFDAEMEEKIARHQKMRGSGWQTIEAPLDLVSPLNTITTGHTVLIDCATLWLTNLILAERESDDEASALIAAIGRCAAPVVVVSNEVGQGIVPENALARRFRNAQGRLNQRLAAEADLVVAVMAGLPMVLKGALP